MRALALKIVGILVALAVTYALVHAYNSTSAVQRGEPGLAMDVIDKNTTLAERAAANKVPFALPPASTEGALAVDAYKNVQVLNHLTTGEMTRLMTAMTLWVAPKQGCAYCHAPAKDANGKPVLDSDGNVQADQNALWSDDLYTKRVARRMLQMTMHVNQDWKTHVKETGVTCYTCHRGNPVPTHLWYTHTETDRPTLGHKAGQNSPSVAAGLSSLPVDPFTPFLLGDERIRVISTEPLPIDNRISIKQTEWTYALMMHMTNALGVNCTYCHNSRSFAGWTATRATAWYGIRMVRDLNKDYLEPLRTTFPDERLGPTGDSPKLNCATCHQGAYKPLLGESMLKDYLALAEAKPQPPKSAPPPVSPTAPAAPATSPQ